MVVVLLLFMSLLLVEVSEIMMMIDRFFVASLSLSRFFSCYPCSYCHRSCRVLNCSVLSQVAQAHEWLLVCLVFAHDFENKFYFKYT